MHTTTTTPYKNAVLCCKKCTVAAVQRVEYIFLGQMSAKSRDCSGTPEFAVFFYVCSQCVQAARYHVTRCAKALKQCLIIVGGACTEKGWNIAGQILRCQICMHFFIYTRKKSGGKAKRLLVWWQFDMTKFYTGVSTSHATFPCQPHQHLWHPPLTVLAVNWCVGPSSKPALLSLRFLDLSEQ